MNDSRRARLKRAQKLMDTAMDIIMSVRDEEHDAYDNMPESIQDSERGEQMAEYIDMLEEAWNSVEEAWNTINEVI